MSDLNWCTYCDNAIDGHSDSLYCSDECLRADALNHHPLLGYDYAELKNFPRPSSPTSSSSSSCTLSSTTPSAATTPTMSSPSSSYSEYDTSSTVYLLSPPPSPVSSYGSDKDYTAMISSLYSVDRTNKQQKQKQQHATTNSIFYI
ncbi:hypothetical protein BDB00DRAFT_948920 [Zychaea mexicana]|uniref:uncharacterized protein n=1 Tax=Zychaea mexicana TaxID=64656 RepID=UPI0022FF321D|nr:uncharacterized protein BDB00DRAFT_948920 [Zychaea mexicana]KAI9499187.1 hypothetical protein BDB00DRAFT_948920 [Zychaea mexicana]